MSTYPVEFGRLEKENKELQAKIERLREALEAIIGLTHYHYTVCNIDDQSEDEIAAFVKEALQKNK